MKSPDYIQKDISIRVLVAAICIGLGSVLIISAGLAAQPKSKPKASIELGVGELYAVLVGISKYKDSALCAKPPGDEGRKGCIETLTRPVADVKAMAEFLNGQKTKRVFKKIHITPLINEKATRNDIWERLEELSSKVGKDDTVILYFSGHGA
ncbi:caspase family protein, partial [Thermodesulfobacteriota bacterium]